MRLVSYEADGGGRAGILRDERVHALEGGPRTVDELLRDGALGGVRAGDALEGVALLPPVGRPGKIICIGLNYRSHCEEQGAEPPETPTFFAKFANALRAPGATVALPAWSRQRGLRGRGGVRDRLAREGRA